LSIEDFHKGIREECEISLLFRVPENLKGCLRVLAIIMAVIKLESELFFNLVKNLKKVCIF